ncbi:unnamed protein product [Arabidopsis thaliana]|uniref:(thale cress) hypothetical protein n=1 Tax=Arabidopsis thaliana TaxID=3702 RepID=A0A7G2FCT2_ARATH|nr:unnamed protein product [Arabidopsis thaliana]
MSMEKPPLASGLARTRSEQLYETVAADIRSPHGSMDANGVPATAPAAVGGGGTLSRKSSRRLMGMSPGRSSGAGTHIRKSRSAQLKLELEEVSSGAALSRASSASLGLSFSFTGFAMPPEEISDSKPFSDDEMIPEDIEAGKKKPKFQAEPTLPIFLKFRDVTYKVVIKKLTSSVEKEILTGISGSVNPGEVLALMGPSGSGKTTLLSLLAGRISQSSTGGSVTYNDKPYSKYLKSKIGFVTQDDVLFPHLTVKETLTYAARLRLPKTLTREQKKQRALDVIQELGLERCQDTMIGGAFAGKTVITTIHQPSSRLFHRFDKLILLGRGSLLYFGKSSEALDYFSSIGCSPLIAMNPAEFLLDLANGNINDISVPSELDDRVQVGNSGRETQTGKPSPAAVHEYLVEAYETRVAEQEKKKLLDPVPLDEEAKAKSTRLKRQWGTCWWEQYCILFCRGLKERRHEYFSWLRVTQVLSTAVILGLLWWQSDIRTPMGLQDQAGLLFFIAVFWGFFPVFTAIFAFPQERAMLNKERAADMYRLSAYFLARTTSDLPLDFILPSLFLLVVYFMTGLRISPYPFFLSMLTVFLCIIAAQGLGLAIGAILMDLKKATTLASKVPVFISWIRYLSFNYHTYKLLLKVQYQDFAVSINGMRIDNGLTEVAALVVMIFGYRLLAYLSLRQMKIVT